MRLRAASDWNSCLWALLQAACRTLVAAEKEAACAGTEDFTLCTTQQALPLLVHTGLTGQGWSFSVASVSPVMFSTVLVHGVLQGAASQTNLCLLTPFSPWTHKPELVALLSAASVSESVGDFEGASSSCR